MKSLPLFTRPDLSLQDFLDAPSGKGPLTLDWDDKPHRLVYDLVKEVEALRAGLESRKIRQ